MTTPNPGGGSIEPYSDSDASASNLPFHPWIKGYDRFGVSPNDKNVRLPSVQRGFIRTDPSISKDEDKPTPSRRLYFLYNPGTIDNMTFSMDSESSDALYFTRKDGGQQTSVTPMQQSFTIPLLFDRSYELSYPNAGGFSGAGIAEEGAWRDVRAALALIGALDESTGDVYQMPASGFATQAMVQYPCYIHLGSSSQSLTFFGRPTGLTVSWTHWSHSMVPIRVGISLGFELMQRSDIAAPAPATEIPGSQVSSWLPDALSQYVPGASNYTTGAGSPPTPPTAQGFSKYVPNGGLNRSPAAGSAPTP